MLRALIWKDVRLNRVPLFIAGALVVGSFVAMTLMAAFDPAFATHSWQQQFFEILLAGSLATQATGNLSLAVLSGNLVAAERMDRSAEFLAYLPPSRGVLLRAKAILLATMGMLLLAIPLGAYFVGWLAAAPLPMGLASGLRFVGNIAAFELCTAGIGWLASCYLTSNATAILIALATPWILTTAVHQFSVVFDHPKSASLAQLVTWLIVGVAGFVFGTRYYLSRTELESLDAEFAWPLRKSPRGPIGRRAILVVALLLLAIVPLGAYFSRLELNPRRAVAISPFTDEEQLVQITDAFRLYAQAFDGRFPDVDRFYGDELIAAVQSKLNLPAGAGQSARFGFGRLTVLQKTDPTFRYFGSGIKLGEADRILIHWQTAADKNKVIFGDLTHRDVDDLGLASLLSPWHTLANRCVVRIHGGGSGTVVSPDGLIVTADHVLPSESSKIDVHFADGRKVSAIVEQRSKRLDAAVLRIASNEPMPFVEMEAPSLSGNRRLWAIGYPFGRHEPLVRETAARQLVLDELIATWNNMSGGDSGGALLDSDGHLVSIMLGPADRKTLRAASAAAIRDAFPMLAKPGIKPPQGR